MLGLGGICHIASGWLLSVGSGRVVLLWIGSWCVCQCTCGVRRRWLLSSCWVTRRSHLDSNRVSRWSFLRQGRSFFDIASSSDISGGGGHWYVAKPSNISSTTSSQDNPAYQAKYEEYYEECTANSPPNCSANAAYYYVA